MSTLDEVGERDAWRCWLCDEPVDRDASVNADRAPSVDTGLQPRKGRKGAGGSERLAHRACNTGKGATAPVVPWGKDLFVVDPAPIVATVDRLRRKGGREVVARCPTRPEAEAAGTWLLDRLSRFAPDLTAPNPHRPGWWPVPARPRLRLIPRAGRSTDGVQSVAGWFRFSSNHSVSVRGCLNQGFGRRVRVGISGPRGKPAGVCVGIGRQSLLEGVCRSASAWSASGRSRVLLRRAGPSPRRSPER